MQARGEPNCRQDPGAPAHTFLPELGAAGCGGSWEGSCAQYTSWHGGVRVNIPALSQLIEVTVAAGWCGSHVYGKQIVCVGICGPLPPTVAALSPIASHPVLPMGILAGTEGQ